MWLYQEVVVKLGMDELTFVVIERASEAGIEGQSILSGEIPKGYSKLHSMQESMMPAF